MRRIVKQICILLCIIAVAPIYAHDFILLKNTENEFNQNGLNLKGDVFSVVTQEVSTKKEFGEIIPTKYYTTDSIVFDSEGRIIEKYINSNNRELYEYYGDDIFVIKQSLERDKWVLCDSIKYQRLRDDKGRLVQETVYKNGEPTSRISFNFTPTGYKVEYFPNISGSAEKYELKNNTIIRKTIFGPETFKFDNDEKIIRCTGSAMKVNFINIWEYNENGDLVLEHKKADAPWPGMGKTIYTYEYDDSGNWVTKKWDNKWYVRKIIYKTPEERKAFEVQQLAREKAINDSLFALGASRIEENCNNFVNGKLESRGYNAARDVERFGYNLPFEQKVSNVSTNADGSYNMTMASGAELKNLSFDLLKDQGPNCFITPDGKTALILSKRRSYPFLGVVNFNIDVEGIRHNANKLANAMKSDTIAMIEIGKNLSSDNLWQKNYAKLIEQSDQYDNGINEINYIPFDVAAEMVYPKGFVEKDNLREQFRKCADFISIKNAVEHIEFNSKGKPLAQKIKKWEQIDNNNYQVVFKAKEPSRIFSFDYIRIEDSYGHFLGEKFIMNCQRMGIEIVGISMDKRFILVPVLYSSKNKITMFLIEIDDRGEYVASYYFEKKI